MKFFLPIFFALLALGIVGTMDLEDAKADANYYNDMVCQGAWPNYKQVEVTCNNQN